MRLRLELAFVDFVPLHRRAGQWRLIGPGAYVYRGDRAGQVARTAGGLLPAQHRGGDTAGLLLQLRDWPPRPGGHGKALETRGLSRARGVVLADAVHHSAQPALAGEEGPRPG